MKQALPADAAVTDFYRRVLFQPRTKKALAYYASYPCFRSRLDSSRVSNRGVIAIGFHAPGDRSVTWMMDGQPQ
jgi:hypothetical protein